jgi:hypothetical protein
MSPEKMPRRSFLKGLAATAAGAMLSACRVPEQQPTQPNHEPPKDLPKPTEAPFASGPGSPGEAPTLSPSPENTAENITNLPSTVLSQELLLGLAIGGGTAEDEIVSLTPEPPVETTTTFGDLLEFTGKNWNRELTPEDFKDPVVAVKYLLSLGEHGGFEDTTYNPEQVYPMLENLRFFRCLLPEFPGNAGSISGGEETYPRDLVMRKGTAMTVVGSYTDEEGGKRAVVSFTEGFDRSRITQPKLSTQRMYFADIPETSSENSSISLEQLLSQLDNVSYEDGKIKFSDTEDTQYAWEINKIDSDLLKQIQEDAGKFWIDRKPDSNLYENPVVKDLSEDQKQQYGKLEIRKNDRGLWEYWGQKAENGEIELLYTPIYNFESKDWSWLEIPSLPEWIIPVSNAEIRYNPQKESWEYYSQTEGKKGAYVVSIRQNEKGESEFHSFAEELIPRDHPELFMKASWNQIIRRMDETKSPKVLPVDVEKVSLLDVERTPVVGNEPYGLRIYFGEHPVTIYYPYAKASHTGPDTSKRQIFMEANGNDHPSVGLYVFDESFNPQPGNISESKRIIQNNENLVGETGKLAKLGDAILRIDSGFIVLVGRNQFPNDANLMNLDSFVKDPNGRLLHP